MMVSDFQPAGSITLSDVARVCRAAWQVHVDMYASVEPDAASLFTHYADLTVAAEFGSEAGFRSVYEQPGRQLFVCWDGNGRLCGHVAATVQKTSCELWRMAVHPEAHRQGVARLLHNAVFAHAAAAGCTQVWLTTGMVMQSANRLYVALGYELESRSFIPQFRSMINKYRMDISSRDRQRLYDCEIAVWERGDGWLEARHGRRTLGAVNGARLWETRGEVDSAARSALLHYLELQRRGTAPFLVALGERRPLRPRFDAQATRVRRLRPEDELAVRALFVQSWVSHLERWEHSEQHLGEMLYVYVQSSLRKDLLAPYARAWVAENDGCLLGMVAMTREGELRRLAVHPLARGLGVARLLVARLERYAKRTLRLESVFLWTGTFMFVSRFYVQCGYRHEGTRIIPVPTTRFPFFTTAIQLFRKVL